MGPETSSNITPQNRPTGEESVKKRFDLLPPRIGRVENRMPLTEGFGWALIIVDIFLEFIRLIDL
jgi:hypothetical protein